MKKQWAIIDKKTNHQIGVYSSKEEAKAMIEKYMHKDEMVIEEYIPFDGNEGIYARETDAGEEAEKRRFGQMMTDVA